MARVGVREFMIPDPPGSLQVCSPVVGDGSRGWDVSGYAPCSDEPALSAELHWVAGTQLLSPF